MLVAFARQRSGRQRPAFLSCEPEAAQNDATSYRQQDIKRTDIAMARKKTRNKTNTPPQAIAAG
jgi:hypothetical protein